MDIVQKSYFTTYIPQNPIQKWQKNCVGAKKKIYTKMNASSQFWPAKS